MRIRNVMFREPNDRLPVDVSPLISNYSGIGEFGECLMDTNSFPSGMEELEVTSDRLSWLTHQVFSLHEIFSIILKKLSVKDLLRCSLVSTSWQLKSRVILRDKKICAVRIQDNETCEALEQLDMLLQDSIAIPFNGLSIRANFFRRRGRPCLHCEDIESLYPTLTNLKIKYLRIDWFEFPQCPAWKLVQKILEDQAVNLEILSVTSPLGMNSLVRRFHVSKDQWCLPKLRAFDVELPPGSDFYPLMSEIFDVSPSLKQIYGSITPEKLEFLVMSNQAKNVKELWLCPIASQLNSCINFVKECPQLRKLYVSSHNFQQDLYSGEFIKLLHILILNCCGYLEELMVDRRDFVLLIREILTVLRRASKAPQMYANELLFPRLHLVELYSDANLSDCIANIRETSEDIRFGTVKKLRIHQRFQVPCLTSFFPNVTTLELTNVPELASYLPKVWTAWPRLEQLTFEYVNRVLVCIDADAPFCGVTVEEMNLLRQADRKFWKEYHLVPIMPSVRNLSHLKKLRLNIMFDFVTNQSHEKTHFLSEITDHLVLAKMQNLSVEIFYRNYCIDAEDFGPDCASIFL